MKQCRRCLLSKELSEFYVHSKMLDGHLNICKKCTTERICKERRDNPEKHSEREKRRYIGSLREKILHDSTKRNKENPEKRKPHYAVNNAVRDGRLNKPDSCSSCGRTGIRIDGHHEDYSKALEVIWLCVRCHRRRHAEINRTSK